LGWDYFWSKGAFGHGLNGIGKDSGRRPRGVESMGVSVCGWKFIVNHGVFIRRRYVEILPAEVAFDTPFVGLDEDAKGGWWVACLGKKSRTA
jgi:hypothetical protein